MDKKVARIIIRYRQGLEALGIKVKRILLYGSYARGNPRPDSDMDLVVVSDDFREMDTWERLCLLGRARIGIYQSMEILGVTEKEFQSQSSDTFIGSEVKEKGIEVT
jgi:hypothetical protein